MGTATPVRDAPQGPPTKGMSMTAIEAAFHPDSAELAAFRDRIAESLAALAS